jgi:hypothetical protein
MHGAMQSCSSADKPGNRRRPNRYSPPNPRFAAAINHATTSRSAKQHELLDLLKNLDMDPRREGRRNLVEFVARELSETGRFIRIAAQGSHAQQKDN